MKIAEQMARLALEKKAENVVVLDMTRVSGMCDYFVVCSATSKTRARAIAEHVQDEMKKDGVRVVHRDGMQESDWIVLDFSDVVVHIFLAELRRHYDLESLWGDAPRRTIAEKHPEKAEKPAKPAKAEKPAKRSKK